MAALLAERPPFSRIISPEQFHDLGKLMLAFVMLWAYFALLAVPDHLVGQPARGDPLVPRTARKGGWQWVALGARSLFHFALPFLVLLSRDVKRHAARWSRSSRSVLIVARFVDLFWLVRPAFAPAGFAVHWLDPAALLGDRRHLAVALRARS